MQNYVEDRLAELGITLPAPSAGVANYLPFVQTGNLVFISGQISQTTDGPLKGRLGDGFDAEQGAAAARTCAVALMAQLRAACDGDLSRVVRVVKLTGFVNGTANFSEHPRVINGASDLFVDVFGDAGRHARAAVGSSSLPFGVAVEVEGVFEIA